MEKDYWNAQKEYGFADLFQVRPPRISHGGDATDPLIRFSSVLSQTRAIQGERPKATFPCRRYLYTNLAYC